jgi:hypothetical protein
MNHKRLLNALAKVGATVTNPIPRNRILLSDQVLTTLREDPSLMHRMPESAWDATRYTIDQHWRFLSDIGLMPEDEARAFALWYSGVRDAILLMHAAEATSPKAKSLRDWVNTMLEDAK